MRDFFEPETRNYLCAEYRMLIVDGHASRIYSIFPRTCLYLPAHSTHLLQPLDIGVFGPLKHNYKTLPVEQIRFTTYNIDKADFISLIQKTWQKSITTQNI